MHDPSFYLRYVDHFSSSRDAILRSSSDVPVLRSDWCSYPIDHLRIDKEPIAGPASSQIRSTSFILLYISHFLQTFGDRLWQFAVPLLLTELFIDTLFPQALFTFFTYLAVFLFMPLFGAWIDSTNRLYVVTTTIWIQNICICISSVVMFILAYFHESIIVHHSNIHNIDYKLILSFSGLLITSMLGQIMGNGATLSLEKDWVVILCGDDKNALTTVNARMRRIDLICKIIAPATFGIYTEFLGNNSLQKVSMHYLFLQLRF